MRFKNTPIEEVKQIVEYAISNQINYFEVCDFYMNSTCESSITSILSNYSRNSYFLCDKFPPNLLCKKLDFIKDFFYKQLEKCNTSYFDYYLLQSINKRFYEELSEDIIEFFNEMKQKGIIHNLGFSFHGDQYTLKKMLSRNKWDVVQLSLNYYDWYLGDAKILYQQVKAENIPIFVMNPCKGGLLIDGLPSIAKERLKNNSMSPTELCFKFLTTLSGVKLILTGVNNLDMLKGNIRFFKQQNYGITACEKEEVLLNLEDIKKFSYIACTDCAYCIKECKQKVPINDLFQNYNKWITQNDIASRDYIYDLYEMNKGILACKACGLCEKVCPQNLPIRDLFHNIIFYVKR